MTPVSGHCLYLLNMEEKAGTIMSVLNHAPNSLNAVNYNLFSVSCLLT